MTDRPLVQQAAEWIIRRACQHLGGDARAERYREWAAELPAILHDPEVNPAVVRYFRAVSYAAGTYWTARQLRRVAGPAAGDALRGGWRWQRLGQPIPAPSAGAGPRFPTACCWRSRPWSCGSA